jgi:hypothetical protein
LTIHKNTAAIIKKCRTSLLVVIFGDIYIPFDKKYQVKSNLYLFQNDSIRTSEICAKYNFMGYEWDV